MNIEVYKFIFRTYGSSIGQWVGFFAELFRTVVMRVYVAIAIAQVTANVASGNFDAAKKYTLYFFIAYLAAVIIGAFGELLSTHAEEVQFKKLAVVFYQKLIGKDVSFYRDNQTGYLASLYRQHLDAALLLLGFLRGDAMGAFVSLVVPPVVLFFKSPQVGLVAATVVLIQFAYVAWSSCKVDKHRQLSHEIYRKITGEVSDVITNIIAFKSGGIEDKARGKMVELVKQETAIFGLRRGITTLLELPRSIITACGITVAVYLIVSNSASAAPQSLGLIVLTLTYMFQIIRSVDALPSLVRTHDDLTTKLYPTLKYLGNDYEKICDPVNPKELLIKKGAINIDKVNFSYPSNSRKKKKISVFNNLNIKIKGGEQVGVVGLSGAGKSTLASLLLRFDEIGSGSIKIDGIDIRDVRQSELRQKIAYVPQEPLLFHRSIKENIAYYNSDTDDKEIIRAAKAAHAHEFIKKLPDGYDTIVGERGVKLSGGQKQRVAIARAILKKAPIMIFDEATSALDSESEQIIQRALPEIIGKQTAIVVAHRLSTVAGLDRIIVLHEGKIVESGSHEELLDLNGRYNSLWQKQTSEFSS
ncbi:MAG: ABC transporter-like protein [Candidatus Moranbacteria bacterium GW2011_GWC2_37_8]|nr:MAG: ABC transporter-like protein [Candidatus Moranbacteria bacterium GW2011_GWC2_37_8]KKQ62735.1 MAG: ABC-type multidrug transport system, ATPase and permease component, ATP-binding cassette, subfamily B, bacterial [Parcubacteria group bacterium GW2011_GWC1_38_22]